MPCWQATCGCCTAPNNTCYTGRGKLRICKSSASSASVTHHTTRQQCNSDCLLRSFTFPFAMQVKSFINASDSRSATRTRVADLVPSIRSEHRVLYDKMNVHRLMGKQQAEAIPMKCGCSNELRQVFMACGKLSVSNTSVAAAERWQHTPIAGRKLCRSICSYIATIEMRCVIAVALVLRRCAHWLHVRQKNFIVCKIAS